MTSISKMVENLVRPEIRALSAYPVGDASGMIKLDAMENPHQWSAELKQAWLKKLEQADINRYPNPQAPKVKAGLRKAMNVPEEFDCLLGNGSDEIIQLLAMLVAKPGAKIMAPEPGFVMYKMIATFCGLDYIGVPLTEVFELDMPAMLKCINEQQPELIFFAQPNNPTANLYSESQLRELIQASEGLVIMDEAYLPFSSRNHLHFLEEFDNVLVMRTLSKVGLAGLRLGMIFGRSEWLNELDKIRMPYNINVLTQLSAEFALEHYDILIGQCELIKQERSRMQNALTTLGFTCYESEANFILARASMSFEGQAKEIFEQLKQHNILIKCLAGGHPLLENCLRFTIGTEKENTLLLEALTDIL
jgi:histidinol-phosphate aminotransferase